MIDQNLYWNIGRKGEPTDRQTDRHTGMQSGSQTDRQTDRSRDAQTNELSF